MLIEVIGYLFFIFMGICLGLTGAGGSVLTIPILIYVYKIPVILSTTYALFIVGVTSLLAFFQYWSLVSYHKIWKLIIPCVMGVFISRAYILHNIPEMICGIRRDSIIIILIAVFMFFSAYKMIKGAKKESLHIIYPPSNIISFLFISFSLGIAVGLLGVGGGSLVTSALILFLGYEIRHAVATSLLIIMLNSFVGFISDPTLLTLDDYKRICLFSIFSIIGMVISIYISKRAHPYNLKNLFGWIMFSASLMLIIREFFF